ncbi:MAG: DNA methyltransferase, partial [Promethearchaeota archaeon]
MDEQDQKQVILDWKGKNEIFPEKLDFRIIPVKTYRCFETLDDKNNLNKYKPENRLILGENLKVMKLLLENGYKGKIDLIYVDPPFLTGDDFYTKTPVSKDGISIEPDVIAYQDRWEGGLTSYLSMLHQEIHLMHELLSVKGAIFVHVDWHAGHYIKILLDEIFGKRNFRNEIVWHYGGPSPVKTSFPKKHDIIFFYSKSDDYTFFPQYKPLKDYLFKRARKDPDGRLWVDQNVGQITKRKFEELDRKGKIFKTKTGRFRRKQY